MTGYTKVFASMLDSTVWQLSKEARILWITMLLKKDRNQMVRAAVPGLAHAARLTPEETESALRELSRPDKWSQSKAHQGRRVIKTEDGYLIVNGAKYRQMLSAEERKEYKRVKQREYDARKRSIPMHGEAVAIAGGQMPHEYGSDPL